MVHARIGPQPISRPAFAVLFCSADCDFQSQRFCHTRLGQHGIIGGFRGSGVSDLDMIGFVSAHHLIAIDSVEYRVHDGPLWRGRIPTALGFLQWQLYGLCPSQIHFQPVRFHEDATPDDFARFADPLDGTAA